MADTETVGTAIIFPEKENCCDTGTTNSTTKWKSEADRNLDETLKVLDPEDRLMKRFQDALKAHLTRIDQRLSEDILNLVSFSMLILKLTTVPKNILAGPKHPKKKIQYDRVLSNANIIRK